MDTAFERLRDRSPGLSGIEPGDHLVFGRESVGLPAALLNRHPGRSVSIPLRPGERSLNLSNAVSIAVYEIVRKMIGSGRIQVDQAGRMHPGSGSI
jgi:tRNA (cytidine/uridine-2'-O-)-methyltransferase